MTTVAVIDFAHSGTTMVAGVLEVLGVPMVGANRLDRKWEDLDIVNALLGGREDEFAALTRARDRAHGVWGFKFPGAWKFAANLDRHLVDPVYIAIYKDPVSVTRRRFGGLTANKLHDTALQMERSLDGIRGTGWRVRFLSYLKAVADPEGFARELADAIGMEVCDRELVNAAGFVKPNTGGARNPYPSVAEYLEELGRL